MRAAVLFPFFAASQCLELAFVFCIVYLKISRRPENLVFSLVAFFMGGMIACELLLQETDNLSRGLLWDRLQFACIFFGDALLLQFIPLAVGYPLPRRLALTLYPVAAVLAAGAFHPLVLHPPPPACLPGNVDREAPGPLFYPYAVLPQAGAVLASVLGLRGLKRHRQRKGREAADFRPLFRHVEWIVAGVLLVVAAAAVEVLQILLIRNPDDDLPINPRAVAATLFCFLTAWVLGREVFLTEQRKRRLDDENRFLDALAQSRLQTARDVQHEVKNKLAGIATPLKVVRLGLEQGRETARLQERLADALAEAEDLDALVGRMLNTARMEAGLPPQLEAKRPTDVPALVRALCEKKERALAQERQARLWEGVPDDALPRHVLSLSCRVEHPVAPAHADTLTLILENLLDNAVKYSPFGGDVAVTLAEGAGELEIAVSDAGLGIAPEDQPRLFDEPFQRGRLAARDIAGTGLGLNMVKRLLDAQGGRIGVRSAPDRGSAFTLTVPWEPGEPEP